MTEHRRIKAAFWYTISNFAVKGLSFIVTPVFTRLMSTESYGLFSNYNSWRGILITLITMELAASVNRARFDYSEKKDEYISSIATISVVFPILVYIVVVLNINYFEKLFQLDAQYIHVMFFSIIFSHSIEIYMATKIINYEYKESIFITLLSSISTLGLSIGLVFLMENQLLGRILGEMIPAVIIGVALYITIMVKGKAINVGMIKYAILISLPYIPHLLAGNILNQSDRIVITKLIGASETAKYSVACTASMLISIFLRSLNSAWSPWLGEMIIQKKYNEIKEKSRPYLILFFVAYIGAILISPELLLFLGGEKYKDAIMIMPALISSTMFQFLYTQYVNIEQFEKKVWRVAAITCVAASVNVIGNYYLIPKYGYIAAAYTTMLSMIIMWILNYISVYQMGLSKVYDTKEFFEIGLITVILCIVSSYVYKYSVIRYIMIGLYLIVLSIYIVKNKNVLIAIVRKR